MRLLSTALLCLSCAVVLGACGSEDEERPAAAPALAAETRLDVAVTGAGKPQTLGCAEAECDAAALSAALAPTGDSTRACTEIYGGREEARVTGTLEGKPIDVTLSRTNGCNIADYEAFFAALGEKQPLATP